MTHTRKPLSRRSVALVAGSAIAAFLTLPAMASGAGTPTTTTIAPTTTIVDGEVEGEGEGEVEPGGVTTTIVTDGLPDAEAADADAVAGQPTFTG